MKIWRQISCDTRSAGDIRFADLNCGFNEYDNNTNANSDNSNSYYNDNNNNNDNNNSNTDNKHKSIKNSNILFCNS